LVFTLDIKMFVQQIQVYFFIRQEFIFHLFRDWFVTFFIMTGQWLFFTTKTRFGVFQFSFYKLDNFQRQPHFDSNCLSNKFDRHNLDKDRRGHKAEEQPHRGWPNRPNTYWPNLSSDVVLLSVSNFLQWPLERSSHWLFIVMTRILGKPTNYKCLNNEYY